MAHKNLRQPTRNLPLAIVPRELTLEFDGASFPVRYYSSPNPTRLVLLDAPDQTESEREDVALYISAFGAAQVYRLRADTLTDARADRERGLALLRALAAREPDVPHLFGAFSTELGLQIEFPNGYFGEAGELPPHRFVTARDGAQLALREYAANTSRAILLLHGSTTHDGAYAPLARFMASRNLARVYALTLRGHGLSGGARGDVAYSAQHVEDIADTIRFLRVTAGAEKIFLLGHSLGGGLALRFLESSFAGMTDGAILLAPYIGSRAPLQDRKSHVIAARVFWQNAAPLTIFNALGVTRGQHLPCIEFEMLEGFRTPMETPRYSYRAWMAVSPSRRLHRALEKFHKPTLVVLSEGDEIFVLTKLEAFFARVAQLECVRVNEPTHSGIAFHPETHTQLERWLKMQG
ncbi:MAG: 2-succinyl-6-hydroxy-2,4-cyclohexadiene-1-carboxylate synthase [Anaerolineae bacterium]|nr:2-succinyl-6-hydroxy-2,4-cyclohexadiene-1-carboxylate synthase [Anaerolineae bacterium]